MTRQTNKAPAVTIHTIAAGWEALDNQEEGIAMDREKMAADIRALLKLPDEPADGEKITTKVWEEMVGAPFRATYRQAYITRREKAGTPWKEADALNASRQALFKLKGRAKIRCEDVMEVPATKPAAPAEPKKKGGRPRTVYECPCCKAALTIEGKTLVAADPDHPNEYMEQQNPKKEEPKDEPKDEPKA